MSHTVRLPYDVASAATARRFVAADMTAQEIGARLVDDVALVISELVANSVRHARPLPTGDLEVSWDVHGDAIEVAVTDGGGEVPPAPRVVGPDDVSGRGLTIVARLADNWGVQDTPNGTTVWAVVRIRRSDPAPP